VTDETTFGIATAVGTDTEYARQDHTHGSPTNPVTAHAADPDAHHAELTVLATPVTDNAAVRFHLTAGKVVQNGQLLLPDHTYSLQLDWSAFSKGRVLAFDNLAGTFALTAGAQTFTDKTLTTPTIGDFTNATHNHQAAAGGGTVDHTDLTTIGTNTHAQIDTHIADTSDPHGSTMSVSVKVQTPELENTSGDITIDAIDAADHSEVTVENSNGTYYTGVYAKGTYGLDVYANGSLGATPTINWKKSNLQTGTLSADATISFTAPVRAGMYHLIITQGASAYTVTWPAAVKWVDGGTEPVQTTTASAIDLYHLVYDGTNWYGYHGPNHA
jgi:hypothetical protein